MKKLFFAFAALSMVFMASSCSKEEIAGQNAGRTPLNFRVKMGKMTRAFTKDAEVNTFFNKKITVFSVDASGGPIDLSYDGGTTNVFYLIPIDKNTDGDNIDNKIDSVAILLTYNATEATNLYLPETADEAGSGVYFAAFANSADAAIDRPNFTLNGSGALVLTNFTNTPQSELLGAVSGEILLSTPTISLYFFRTVSELLFSVDRSAGGLEDITINSLKLTVPSQSTWTVGSGEDESTYSGGYATPVTYGDSDQDEVAYDDTYATSSATASTNPFASLFVLHGTPLADASVTVNYTISYAGESVAGATNVEKTIGLGDFNGAVTAWNEGVRYKYIFKPTIGGGSLNQRTWTVDVTGAAWTNDSSFDDGSEPWIEPDVQP